MLLQYKKCGSKSNKYDDVLLFIEKYWFGLPIVLVFKLHFFYYSFIDTIKFGK